jgi:hypothetical protein
VWRNFVVGDRPRDGGAFAIVCVIEWLAGRDQPTFVRPAATAPSHPVVEAERVDDTDEHDSSVDRVRGGAGTSDAMTIIGALAGRGTDRRKRAGARAGASA